MWEKWYAIVLNCIRHSAWINFTRNFENDQHQTYTSIYKRQYQICDANKRGPDFWMQFKRDPFLRASHINTHTPFVFSFVYLFCVLVIPFTLEDCSEWCHSKQTMCIIFIMCTFGLIVIRVSHQVWPKSHWNRTTIDERPTVGATSEQKKKNWHTAKRVDERTHIER